MIDLIFGLVYGWFAVFFTVACLGFAQQGKEEFAVIFGVFALVTLAGLLGVGKNLK